MENNFGNIWVLLTEFNFDIDLTIYRDLTCGICKGILINPYHCKCGSKYCKLCMENYLNGVEKRCPSPTDDCSIRITTVGGDLSQDCEANKKISSIKVKCPEQFCHSFLDLQHVKEHLKIHQIQCPYRNLGCMKPRVRCTAIDNHLHNKVYDHTTLLLDSIYHLQNEVASMKDELIFNKENLRKKEVYLIEIQTELENLKSVDRKMLEEITKLKQTDDKYQDQMGNINRKNEINNKQIQRKKEEIKHGNSNIIKNGKFDLSEPIKQKNTDLELGLISDHIDSSGERFVKQCTTPFEWNVDLFKVYKQENQTKIHVYRKMFSNPFYSHRNGYKMRLRVDRGGLSFGFSIHFHIMKGEFDDSLAWPMPFEILIGFVDTVTGSGRVIKRFLCKNVSEMNKISFLKPTNKMNPSCGTRYIQLRDIVDKSICIKCVVNIDN